MLFPYNTIRRKPPRGLKFLKRSVTALGATFLGVTLLPVLVFIPMLAQWRINQTFQDKTDKAAAFTHYILALCILTFSVILLYIAILFKFYVMIVWGVILLSGVFVVTYWIFCCFSDDKKASIKKWIYEFNWEQTIDYGYYNSSFYRFIQCKANDTPKLPGTGGRHHGLLTRTGGCHWLARRRRAVPRAFG